MRNFTYFLIVVFGLITLTSAKPIKTNQKEAIIIGRLVINTESELTPEKTSICFQNGTKGSKKAKVDSAGFFCTKIGVNNSFVDYIQYKDGGDFRKILSEDCMTFTLPEGEKVYYLGDIQLKWTPSDRDKIKKGFSLGIGMGGAHMGGGVAIPISSGHTPDEDCPQITIMDYEEDAISWYKKTYPDDEREIITRFVNLLQD